jgi:hypothetical protein
MHPDFVIYASYRDNHLDFLLFLRIVQFPIIMIPLHSCPVQQYLSPSSPEASKGQLARAQRDRLPSPPRDQHSSWVFSSLFIIILVYYVFK